MFRRCKHKWVLDQAWPDYKGDKDVTHLSFYCALCNKPEEKTIKGHQHLDRLATLIDQELDDVFKASLK